jgi:broad specificity phosphatase PhoE
MKIYLIRHGETDWNLHGRFQGREDIELNETGIKQAEVCGKALNNIDCKAIITSPLKRAEKTAQIVARYAEVERFIVDEKLIERDFGKISGLTPQQREAFYASQEDALFEPIDELKARMMQCIHRYAEEFYPDDIIMVSHGASINAALAEVSHGVIGTGVTRLKNTCINVIEYDKKILSISSFNQTAEEFIANMERLPL